MTTSTPTRTTSLAAAKPAVAATWHPTLNGDLTPDDVCQASNTMAWWQCSSGHSWQALISSRTSGRGCPECASTANVLASLAVEEPEIASQWHPVLNGDLTPEQVSAGSPRVVWWQCPIGHSWQQAINVRRKSAKRCPICTSKRLLIGFNDLATRQPLTAALWHPTRNGTLRACDVFSTTTKVVWWYCTVCEHSYQRSVVSMVRSQGCPKCARNRRTVVGDAP